MPRIEKSCHCEHGTAADNRSEWLRRCAESRAEAHNNKLDRQLYKYTPPGPLEEIDADWKKQQKEKKEIRRKSPFHAGH